MASLRTCSTRSRFHVSLIRQRLCGRVPAHRSQRLGNEPDHRPANSSWCAHIPDLPGAQEQLWSERGFAYSPQWGGFLTGHGKTTIRGGYRMLYDPPFYNIYINMSSSAPEVFLQSFTGAAAASKPLPAVPNGTNVRVGL